jgi:CHRD domain
MVRRIMLSVFVLALAVLTFAHLAAADEMKIKANLTGAAEVPGPGDPNGGGTVQITLNPDKNEVCYDLTLTKVDEATAAHIHEGAVGKDGPVKVGLDAPKGGSAKGCKTAEAAVVKDIMANPANYYVNVHNAAHPKGAVRGQLVK